MQKLRGNMQKQSGVSVLELMLGIVIIATILIASTRFFNIASDNAKVNNAMSTLRQIADASYKWYEYHPNFDGLSFEALFNAGLLPEKYKATTGQVCKACNPWGGNIELQSTADKSRLQIRLTDVPKEPAKTCTKLADQLHEYEPKQKCSGGTFTVIF